LQAAFLVGVGVLEFLFDPVEIVADVGDIALGTFVVLLSDLVGDAAEQNLTFLLDPFEVVAENDNRIGGFAAFGVLFVNPSQPAIEDFLLFIVEPVPVLAVDFDIVDQVVEGEVRRVFQVVRAEQFVGAFEPVADFIARLDQLARLAYFHPQVFLVVDPFQDRLVEILDRGAEVGFGLGEQGTGGADLVFVFDAHGLLELAEAVIEVQGRIQLRHHLLGRFDVLLSLLEQKLSLVLRQVVGLGLDLAEKIDRLLVFGAAFDQLVGIGIGGVRVRTRPRRARVLEGSHAGIVVALFGVGHAFPDQFGQFVEVGAVAAPSGFVDLDGRPHAFSGNLSLPSVSEFVGKGVLGDRALGKPDERDNKKQRKRNNQTIHNRHRIKTSAPLTR